MMKTLFITGANRGIGFALVEAYLTKTDYQIFASYRRADSSGDLLSLAEIQPERLFLFQMDVTETRQIHLAVETLEKQSQKIDLLINNAGMLIQENSFVDMSAENLLQSLKTNTIGALLVTQSMLHLLKVGENPCVVNISSEAGSISTWDKTILGSYAVSKAALNMLTKILSQQLIESGITTVAVHPGNIQTDMGPENPTLPEDCAAYLLPLFEKLDTRNNGTFIQWDGQIIAW